MKKALFVFILFLANSSLFIVNSFAEDAKPDTVNVGIYVTSIHDIDFREKEYSVNLWLWLKYKRPEFDFMKNLEVPMAKTFEKSYATIDTLEDGRIYVLMKLQCVMKGTWRIDNFPFDRQKLRFAIENSEYDASELIFTADTLGGHYGKYFLYGWEKDSFNIQTDIRKYETGFGDPSLDEPHSEYSTFKASIVVHRESWELFLKLFLGMYIAFCISCVCFFIHPDNMDSRLALCVGSLFAVIGNKYVIDSALPESNSLTLVDNLHIATLVYIFLVIVSSVYTLQLIKAGHVEKDDTKIAKAERRNKISGWLLFALYVLLNAWFISGAVNSKVFDSESRLSKALSDISGKK